MGAFHVTFTSFIQSQCVNLAILFAAGAIVASSAGNVWATNTHVHVLEVDNAAPAGRPAVRIGPQAGPIGRLLGRAPFSLHAGSGLFWVARGRSPLATKLARGTASTNQKLSGAVICLPSSSCARVSYFQRESGLIDIPTSDLCPLSPWPPCLCGVSFLRARSRGAARASDDLWNFSKLRL